MRIKMEKKGDQGDIWILSDIGESWFSEGVTAKEIADELKTLDNAAGITVHINSYGGDLFDGLAMYSMLVDHKAPITAKVEGIAASAASIVAMAGEKIQVTESGTIMIHDAISGVLGNAGDMRQMADVLDNQSERMAELYAKRSGKLDAAAVRKYMRAETWFSAKEALDVGLATEIVPNLGVSACALPSKHPFTNAPKIVPAKASDRARLALDRHFVNKQRFRRATHDF